MTPTRKTMTQVAKALHGQGTMLVQRDGDRDGLLEITGINFFDLCDILQELGRLGVVRPRMFDGSIYRAVKLNPALTKHRLGLEIGWRMRWAHRYHQLIKQRDRYKGMVYAVRNAVEEKE